MPLNQSFVMTNTKTSKVKQSRVLIYQNGAKNRKIADLVVIKDLLSFSIDDTITFNDVYNFISITMHIRYYPIAENDISYFTIKYTIVKKSNFNVPPSQLEEIFSKIPGDFIYIRKFYSSIEEIEFIYQSIYPCPLTRNINCLSKIPYINFFFNREQIHLNYINRVLKYNSLISYPNFNLIIDINIRIKQEIANTPNVDTLLRNLGIQTGGFYGAPNTFYPSQFGPPIHDSFIPGINIAFTQRCDNNGTYEKIEKGDLKYFTCNCPDTFFGLLCEHKKISHACGQREKDADGKCTICPIGFSGDFCETMICGDLHICLNGGTCKILINKRYCDCTSGYGGKYCEVKINGVQQYKVSLIAVSSTGSIFGIALLAVAVFFLIKYLKRKNTTSNE